MEIYRYLMLQVERKLQTEKQQQIFKFEFKEFFQLIKLFEFSPGIIAEFRAYVETTEVVGPISSKILNCKF